MEGAHFLKTGKLLKLSEQQCVDCADKAQGCRGGFQTDCFEYAEYEAMDLETDYPYTAFSGSCWSKTGGPVKAITFATVVKNSAAQLKAAITKQPTSVTIDAGAYPFVHYMSGIITTPECGTKLDHAVTAVGYGVENNVEYYIVRNSWGPDWGEQGHVRIGITDGPGVCGIQMLSSYPSTN